MARTIGSHGPKTMEAIRKAGLRLIFEHGYAAMSLRQLAAEVGIQSGSLYNHISTKQELLFDLMRDHINELLRQLDRALQGKQRPVDKLRAFTAFHVTYHMTRKREVFIANSELRSLEPKNYEAIVALRGAYEQRLAEILSRGRRGRRVRGRRHPGGDICDPGAADRPLPPGTGPAGGSPRRPSSPPTKSWCCRASPPARHLTRPEPNAPLLRPDGAWQAGAPVMPMTERQPLDEIDLKILSELQRDGRIRNNELAERVGISEPPCRRRVRALRERGYVSAIRATLDEKLLGYEVISFVLIQLQSQAQAPLQAFEKSIAAVPLVLQSWRISGDADYLLKCVARNVEGMHQQLLQFSAMPEVRNIRTFPVLGVAKDAPLPIPDHPAASDPAQ